MNAEEFFDRASAKFERGDIFGAVSDWTQGISLNPNLAPVYYEWGNMLYYLGMYAESIEKLTQAIQCYSDYAKAYYYRGLARYERGYFQEAIEDFTRVISLCLEEGNDNSFWDYEFGTARQIVNQTLTGSAYQYRAYAHFKQGDSRSSVEDLTEAIRFAPTYSNYYNRGARQYLLGNNNEAIADLTEALNLAPDSADALYNRGNARYNLGDESGAFADYERGQIIDETNGNVEPTDEQGAYGRGIARSRIGNIQEAIKDLQTAAKICSERRNMAFYQTVIAELKKLQQ